MKRSILFAVILSLWIGSNCLAAPFSINLDFNAPVPANINDVNGLGTGFTTRLPGTGSAIPANDPNMDLLTSPGKLRLTSTQANLDVSPKNLPDLEMPGLFRASVGPHDIYITALYENVSVLNASDQLGIYVGVDENSSLRAGIHEGNHYVVSENTGGGEHSDHNTFSAANAFTTGDDIELTLSRQAGLWSLSWNNLTAATGGSLPAVEIPWLDAESDLYFGVHAANVHSPTSFVAVIDHFSLTVVPEPSSFVLAALGLVGLVVWKRRKR